MVVIAADAAVRLCNEHKVFDSWRASLLEASGGGEILAWAPRRREAGQTLPGTRECPEFGRQMLRDGQ